MALSRGSARVSGAFREVLVGRPEGGALGNYIRKQRSVSVSENATISIIFPQEILFTIAGVVVDFSFVSASFSFVGVCSRVLKSSQVK